MTVFISMGKAGQMDTYLLYLQPILPLVTDTTAVQGHTSCFRKGHAFPGDSAEQRHYYGSGGSSRTSAGQCHCVAAGLRQCRAQEEVISH